VAKKGIMQYIQEHIATCPHLEEFRGLFARVSVDVLEEDTVTYMVGRVPAEPVIKKYVDGSAICQEVFTFASKHYYEGAENIDTNAFYDDFAEWLESSAGEMIMPGGCEIRKLEVTTGGYLFDAEGQKAQYQIQCRLEYYKQAKGA